MAVKPSFLVPRHGLRVLDHHAEPDAIGSQLARPLLRASHQTVAQPQALLGRQDIELMHVEALLDAGVIQLRVADHRTVRLGDQPGHVRVIEQRFKFSLGIMGLEIACKVLTRDEGPVGIQPRVEQQALYGWQVRPKPAPKRYCHWVSLAGIQNRVCLFVYMRVSRFARTIGYKNPPGISTSPLTPRSTRV